MALHEPINFQRCASDELEWAHWHSFLLGPLEYAAAAANRFSLAH